MRASNFQIGLRYERLIDRDDQSHPLADIEEWQEDYLKTIEEAKSQMAVATGVAAPVDEKALKIQMAQQKAAVIKKARDEARAKGLSPEDEKAAVQDAIKKAITLESMGYTKADWDKIQAIK